LVPRERRHGFGQPLDEGRRLPPAKAGGISTKTLVVCLRPAKQPRISRMARMKRRLSTRDAIWLPKRRLGRFSLPGTLLCFRGYLTRPVWFGPIADELVLVLAIRHVAQDWLHPEDHPILVRAGP
jgi:hypothetical protein